jgi:hypothetical protein
MPYEATPLTPPGLFRQFLNGVLGSSHDPHRLSQPVLRITRQSVPFSGLGDCPNNLILPFPSPEKVPTPSVVRSSRSVITHRLLSPRGFSRL